MKLKLVLFTCIIILIAACEKERALDKYYNQPGNYSGSIYDALDSTGLYSNFILAVDSTEFANKLKNTLVTVIAPNDNAFEAYLEKYNYNSVSDVPKEVLEDVIGFHVITWPHSINSVLDAPFWFKRISNMPQRSVFKYDYISGSEREIVVEPKYLHFYFSEMLQGYGANTDDYTTLTGSEISPSTGINIQDVQVDSVLPVGNGWIYYVDQVVEPQQNMDDWLMNSPYSLFEVMYGRFTKYTTDPSVNRTIEVKRSNLYRNARHYRIDMELCFETGGFEEANDFNAPVAGSGFTVFAPEDNALNDFIDTYLSDYPGFKDSINIIDKNSLSNLHLGKVIKAMIKPYMFIDLLVFPSQFLTGEGTAGSDGTLLLFNEQDINEYTFCSNGYGYGTNRYIVPRTFKSVLNPSYSTPSYKYFAAAVEDLDITKYLNSTDVSFTLLMPTDEAFINNNIVLVPERTYVSEYGGSYNDEGRYETSFIDIDPENPEAPARIEPQELFGIVFAHVFEESFVPSAQKQYIMNAPGTYVGISEDSIWSGGNIAVQAPEVTLTPKIVDVIPESATDNGRVYVIDHLIKAPVHSMGHVISVNPAFSRFKDLCENAGLLVDGELDIYGSIPTAFIPTDDAINQAIDDGIVPSDGFSLQYFIKNFFLNKSIFTSQTINQTVESLSQDLDQSTEFKIVYKNVEVEGTYEDMSIKGENNTSFVNVIEGDESNILCTDGIIHQIDGVIY